MPQLSPIMWTTLYLLMISMTIKMNMSTSLTMPSIKQA